jgi:hypothetical protein
MSKPSRAFPPKWSILHHQNRGFGGLSFGESTVTMYFKICQDLKSLPCLPCIAVWRINRERAIDYLNTRAPCLWKNGSSQL